MGMVIYMLLVIDIGNTNIKFGLFEGEEYTEGKTSVGADIFERGLCLPSDIKMTNDEQDKIIEIIKSCF